MKKFNEKVVVITGAGSGMGRALALQFATEGARLALNDYQVSSLEVTAQMVKETCKGLITKAFDVSNKEAMHSFADEVAKEYGQVDVMINNAGVALGRAPVAEVDYDDFEWVMNINFWGMVYGSKAFLPHLMASKEASLVNISSLFGIIGMANQGPYCASKFAVKGFNESLSMEMMLNHPQVVVTSVHPGGIKTNIARDSRRPKGIHEPNHEKHQEKFEQTFFRTTAEEAAKVIIKGIQKKKGRVLIGNDAKFPDFIARLFPSCYIGILAKRMRKMGFDEIM